jgi:hypothetical protein
VRVRTIEKASLAAGLMRNSTGSGFLQGFEALGADANALFLTVKVNSGRLHIHIEAPIRMHL